MTFSSLKVSIYKPIGACLTLFRSLIRMISKSSVPRLFLLNIPSHGNLGDHLISVAEQDFLADNFPDRQIILISSRELYFSIRFALLDVSKEDVLCITGGGFLGSLYDEEERFLCIIQRFPENKLVFFPQSIYYAPTVDGQRKLLRAEGYYKNHKKIYIAARDSSTYVLLRERLMPFNIKRVFLTPDIALYKSFLSKRNRNGVLWCIRGDSESLDTNTTLLRLLREGLLRKGIHQCPTDTYVNRPIPPCKEREEVLSKLEEFSSARLVITDRLHGMVYSVITSTPVIALDNVSKKVSQVYSLWLKNIPFVRFIDDESGVDIVLDDLLSVNYPSFENEEIKELFKPIVDAIRV